jgi:hypothetical protein
MQESNAAWMWSEAFVEALECAMLDPPLDSAERSDWPKFCEKLRHWRHDVEEARKEYQQGRPAQLRYLHNLRSARRETSVFS